MSTENKFLFSTDPDLCCQLNKIDPIEKIAPNYDIWISGVRKSQNSNRQDFSYEMNHYSGAVRYHPMLNWNEHMIHYYLSVNNIPSHPLELQGYSSVGCLPCTSKPQKDPRSGRWIGSHKTECGLHLNLKS